MHRYLDTVTRRADGGCADGYASARARASASSAVPSTAVTVGERVESFVADGVPAAVAVGDVSHGRFLLKR